MSFRLRVIRLVRMIPPGQLATYGQLAELAGRPGAARACGQFMRQASEEPDFPWQRVINSQGRISTGGNMLRPSLQRTLLEAEGVEFTRSGRCVLANYRWSGPEPDALMMLFDDDEDVDEPVF